MGVLADPVTEPLVEAPGQAEHVAPFADIDSGEEDAFVGRELRLESGSDGVHGADFRFAARQGGRVGNHRPLPEYKVDERRWRRSRQRARSLYRHVELVGHRLLKHFDLGLAYADIDQRLAVKHQGVASCQALSSSGDR